jgi:transcriptional regulator with XRE-family HTH domain
VEEAERRRKALMARQSGQRLAEERKRHGVTQAQLAPAMGATPGRVSQIERGELATIDAVACYVDLTELSRAPARQRARACT